MAAEQTTPTTWRDDFHSQSRTWLIAILSSPLLWGGVLTFSFYACIPYLPLQRELAVRYFCSHPLEYATSTLFFIGMAILGMKGLRLWVERAALQFNVLDDMTSAQPADAMQAAEKIDKTMRDVPPQFYSTHLVSRIRDVYEFVRSRRSSEGLERHLKYLAEVAADRLHDSYALIRTITWAVPILGFLGTVIGITLAIANVTPDQLDSSLDKVVSGLAVAFDTTALALGLSLLLVFGSLAIERAERSLLARIEEFGIKRLTGLFPISPEAQTPLGAAEVRAAEQLLERTESFVNWQTELWRSALESMRSRWMETLERQQNEFEDALKQGMATTLEDHTDQLATLRNEFLLAHERTSHEVRNSLQESREIQKEQLEEFRTRLAELWDRMRDDLADWQEDQSSRAFQVLQPFVESVGQWQTQLGENSQAMSGQLGELQKQGELLLRILEQEENLARLEGRLADNLEAVRSVEAFEETLHSLSAAVHLLTIRNKPNAA